MIWFVLGCIIGAVIGAVVIYCAIVVTLAKGLNW